ncbi:hypothetical protein E3N88_19255 [Mikania micrantha]|uniref:Uncharacterized protein n=1 Tax=Mikania micrantha TaxID=192012 RepID=A0A5N6NP06_9ASTR|nr:hypothetical protein E3N88_19255 [Mikania micrantha]
MGNRTTFAPLLKESLPMYYYVFATANNIEITLRGEKADAIGHDISPGNILAITFALVTEFRGVLQLESTNATAIAVNPAIPELQMYLDRFTCAAAIVDIPASITWFYVNCLESGCSNKACPRRKPHLYVRITEYSPIRY